jgi:hypothetical protein
MFAPTDKVAILPRLLINIPNFLETKMHRVVFANRIRNSHRESKDLKYAAVAMPQGSPAFGNTRPGDESLFSRELQMLRSLAGAIA